MGDDVTYGADVTDERYGEHLSAIAGIYGGASDGKRQSINGLPIDDGRRHRRHLRRRHMWRGCERRHPVQSRYRMGRRHQWAMTMVRTSPRGRWCVRYANVADRGC
jgi:hypothetical protein